MSAIRKWSPDMHPRWPKGSGQNSGRFRPKASHSVRVSTKSVSYNTGVRLRVAPKVAVYVGGLARVERVGGGSNVLDKQRAKIAASVRTKGRGGAVAANIFEKKSHEGDGIRITRSNIVSSPTFRASNAPAQERRRGEYQTVGVKTRKAKPPRKARARPQRRNPRKAIQGAKVAT